MFTTVILCRMLRALECSNVFALPALKGDEARIELLHQCGAALKLHTQTIRSSQRSDRYNIVLLERQEQPMLI